MIYVSYLFSSKYTRLNVSTPDLFSYYMCKQTATELPTTIFSKALLDRLQKGKRTERDVRR
jgi:hypothetical protein